MNKTVKQILRRPLWFLAAFYRLVWQKNSYLHSTGWVESKKCGYPCGKDGSELPWTNYAMINIFKERLNRDLSLFEFGCGYSTLFYAKLVRTVISIEHDRFWFNLMGYKIPDNVSLIFKKKDIDGIYCRSINEFKREFDVVIIDGRDRVNCLKQAIRKLSRSGTIVLDDSDRERYFEGIDYAKKNGFRTLSLEGMQPVVSENHRATIFYRDGNCLKI